jgi:hypothetical protein
MIRMIESGKEKSDVFFLALRIYKTGRRELKRKTAIHLGVEAGNAKIPL